MKLNLIWFVAALVLCGCQNASSRGIASNGVASNDDLLSHELISFGGDNLSGTWDELREDANPKNYFYPCNGQFLAKLTRYAVNFRINGDCHPPGSVFGLAQKFNATVKGNQILANDGPNNPSSAPAGSVIGEISPSEIYIRYIETVTREPNRVEFFHEFITTRTKDGLIYQYSQGEVGIPRPQLIVKSLMPLLEVSDQPQTP
jgi:hypothetical protein